jgi:adenylosuccinate synthase
MGASTFSRDDYASRASYRASLGYKSAFAFDEDIKSGKTAAKVHDSLNPYGVKIRESRDSDAHPVSVPVAVFFDTTGSMAKVPITLQAKLPHLMGQFLEDKASGKKYLGEGYPAILVGAIDDYDAQYPHFGGNGCLQVGQFESGIEIDENLEHVWLTGNGGGTYEESYELALYFMARHTAHDHWEKRGRKGYCFLIGDEHAYPMVHKEQVKKVIGDGLQADIELKLIIQEVQERYHVFFILPNMTNHYADASLFKYWVELLGQQNTLKLEDPTKICELIVATVALCEQYVGIDDLREDHLTEGIHGALIPLANAAAEVCRWIAAGGRQRGGYRETLMPKAYVVAGLAWGDEGKGSLVDFLCRRHEADLVVRYNGGPQASHTVVVSDGRRHRFSQLGSGTFSGARTFLSRFMLVEPYALVNEADALAKIGVSRALDLVAIDREAVIITPWHWMANRMREMSRGGARHGSCGFGVGEARRDEISGVYVTVGNHPREMLRYIKDQKIEEMREISRCFPKTEAIFHQMLVEDPREVFNFYEQVFVAVGGVVDRSELTRYKDNTLVFEGAQGALLDETHGYLPPHVTWTDCTFSNPLKLLEPLPHDAEWIGVLRTYFTRHGAGPFPTEDASLKYEDPHNAEGPWQGPFRLGHFDVDLARYAASILKPDCLAITHLDQTHFKFPFVDGGKPMYAPGPDTTETIEKLLAVPVKYFSYGPAAEDKAILERSQHIRTERA